MKTQPPGKVAGLMALLLVGLPAVAGAEADPNATELFRKGRPVRPVTGAADMAQYLRALAARAGTEATQSYVTSRLARQTPAPAPKGKAARPAFEWLAEAITGLPVHLEIDSQRRWCLFDHGDGSERFSHAAAGGVLCEIRHFSRDPGRNLIRTVTHLIFDQGIADAVVATRERMEVLEAVNSVGRRFPADKGDAPIRPAAILRDTWTRDQQTTLLPKADFPDNVIKRLRVRTRVALRTGVTKFSFDTLAHKQPVTVTQSGVTVTVRPLQETTHLGKESWKLPVEIRTAYDEPAGLTAHGEDVHFLASDGKRLRRSGWSGRHSKGRHQMTIRIKPHSIDPASTQMVLTHPTGLTILPVELTFTNVAIRDVKPRPTP